MIEIPKGHDVIGWKKVCLKLTKTSSYNLFYTYFVCQRGVFPKGPIGNAGRLARFSAVLPQKRGPPEAGVVENVAQNNIN